MMSLRVNKPWGPMHVRTTIAAAAVLAVTLVGCSNSDNSDNKAETSRSGTPAATKTADNIDAKKAADIPAEPTGSKRETLLAELKAIDPALVADEDKAIDNARSQCPDIKSDNDPVQTAKVRFSAPGHKVGTDVESRKINLVVSARLCSHG
ncbi:hypothetical protein [Streptomyces sp. NBC_00154]|uniref:hypothetical protein n=1 Tax=Streptomyces sp. NBC_00154 TaxID=2975670 RepID=UPI0022578C58|nr:hypothetical protein [Streptomyces sp. NBC_00154]MCX5317876.1 hypothetical protein [Streptomyces sp. NBC_00154]